MRSLTVLVLAGCLAACDADAPAVVGCDGQAYTPPESSPYVLPYPVRSAYRMGLGNCSSSFHSAGQPDRYAYDFDSPIGSPLTASREGTVVYVEESGQDGGYPNNLVVVEHSDDTFAHYMHLTQGGADVEVGDRVQQGDLVGRSGNTGAAGIPHLHFIVTTGGWRYPYDPVPVSFSNASPLVTVLRQGETYRAAPY